MNEAPSSAVAKEARLAEVLDAYLAGVEDGTSPTPEALYARHPELADDLQACLASLAFIRRAAAQVAEPEAAALPDGGARAAHLAGQLGDFRIVREVAHGGMGVVFEAEQVSLGRRVALKVLPFAATLDPRQLQRFKNEAMAAAHLQHQHIVPVYYVGCERGVHFYAMQYIDGRSLAGVLHELRHLAGRTAGTRPVDERSLAAAAEALAAGRAPPAAAPAPGGEPTTPHEPAADPGGSAAADTAPPAGLATERSIRSAAYFRTVARIGEQAAEALQHAHDRGVLHRDVKPGNLLLDGRGNVWVTDFGLARMQTDASLTLTGDLVGTLRYMSPEQALAKRVVIDERTDVYSLGATLYELLTLEPVFRGSDRQELLRQIAFEEPRSPRRVNKAIPVELETVVLTALAKNPAERYQAAQEMAEDLRRYLEDKPIRRRRPTLWQRLRRWGRRHRAAVNAAAVVVLLAAAVAGGAWLWWAQARAERRAATARAIDEALDRAAVLRGRAAAAPVGELGGWGEAQAEARRAEDALAQGEAEAALRARVAALRDGLKRERAAAERRARDAAAERRLLARLEAIRGEHGEHLNAKRADRAYGEAFRAFGLDLDKVAAGEAGAKLAGRPGTAEIAAALDEWCMLRRVELAEGKEARRWQHLAAVARAADPDPWRNGLRAALGRPLGESAAALKKLAADGKFLEQQPAASLVLLARMLAQVGEGERSAAVLRSAWRRFPGDFWVNFNLGGSSWSRYHYERPEEAVRFLTAAVAARPGSFPAYNNLGNALKDQGKLDEAIACYRQAIKLDPKHAKAHSNLGAALANQGKQDEAIACYRQAIKLDPKLAMAHNNLGLALAKQGKQDEAIACYRQAIKLDPKFAPAHDNLGIALTKQGKLDEAIAACRQAIKLDPKYAPAHSNLGNALIMQGKLDEAIASCRQAIKLDPKFAMAHSNLGGALGKQGKLEEAIAAHRQAIKLDPKNAKVHSNLGNALSKQGKLDEAIAACRQAIKLDPKDAPAHNNLGSALGKQGKLDEAIAACRQAIKLDPKFAMAHSNLGNALADQGKQDEAIACYRQAIKIDPKNAKTHANLGLALAKQGKLDEAIACYRQVIELDPKFAPAHYNLGTALGRQGKLDEAIAALRQAINLDPKNANSHNNLGAALARQGKLDEAIACYRQAIRLDPKDASAHGILGIAFYMQGKQDEAIACYRQAIKIDPKNAKTHANLGLALAKQGKLDEAIACYRQAIKLDPKFALAHNNLGVALKDQGKLDEAITCYRQAIKLDPKFALAHNNLARAERLAAVQGKLPAFLKGEYQPRSSAERCGLAELCGLKKLQHTAAGLYRAAFTADPKLADDRKAEHRYNAACHAALAGCGQGKDADRLDDQARARWRNQALAWLRADLALWTKQLVSGRPDDRRQVANTMQHWQRDTDFVGVRGKDGLAKLPASERAAWQQLWAEVEALRAKAAEKAK
jgi:superkiller protein 3